MGSSNANNGLRLLVVAGPLVVEEIIFNDHLPLTFMIGRLGKVPLVLSSGIVATLCVTMWQEVANQMQQRSAFLALAAWVRKARIVIVL